MEVLIHIRINLFSQEDDYTYKENIPNLNFSLQYNVSHADRHSLHLLCESISQPMH